MKAVARRSVIIKTLEQIAFNKIARHKCPALIYPWHSWLFTHFMHTRVCFFVGEMYTSRPWNFRILPDFSGRILLLTPCPTISLSHHFLRAASAVLILNSHVSGRSYNLPEGVLPTCCCCPIIAIFRLVWIMWAPRPPSSYLVKRVEWEGQHQTK